MRDYKGRGNDMDPSAWDVHSQNVSYSFSNLLLDAAESTIFKIFPSSKKYTDNSKKYTLNIAFKKTHQHTNHAACFSGTYTGSRKEKTPTNFYWAEISGNLNFELLSPQKKVIVSGTIKGDGKGKGRQFSMLFSSNALFKAL